MMRFRSKKMDYPFTLTWRTIVANRTQKVCCVQRMPILIVFIISTIALICVLDNIETRNSRLIIDQKQVDLLRKYRRLVDETMSKISPNFSSVACDDLFTNDNESLRARRKAKRFRYQSDKQQIIFDAPENVRCALLKSTFGFNVLPLSKEEEDFPLAFGTLVYRWADQVYYMLSAIYHPQNVYCIAVDSKSNQSFKDSMHLLDTCFDNVHVMEVDDVEWCGYGTIYALMETLRWLTRSNIAWKYFQYLSGTDLPLKTNREMVRIFKRLNGSFNSEVTEFQLGRLGEDKVVPHNVTLYKSSMSATFNRASADFIVNDEKAQDVFRFLNSTYCPDESLWTSIAGNPHLGMPNAFDAASWLRAINENADQKNATHFPYYISRYQVWATSKYKEQCRGKYVSASCVFGVDDLEVLEERPELIVHKLYLDFQPATYFCLYKRIRERALEPIENFDDTPYGQLPGPSVLRGEPIEDVTIEPAY